MRSKSAQKLHEDGVKLFRKGNAVAALEKFQEALPHTSDEQQQAEIYNDIGATHKQLEDYEAAYEALDEALKRFIEIGDRKGQALTWGNRAAVYEAEGALEEAVETYKRAATMLEEVGESEMAMYVWQAVSRLRLQQKQYIAAIGAYEEGVENMPDNSLKKKFLQGLLRMPGSMLGGLGDGETTDET
jgi:tetratricopeptide (TPR) repeat protein